MNWVLKRFSVISIALVYLLHYVSNCLHPRRNALEHNALNNFTGSFRKRHTFYKSIEYAMTITEESQIMIV